MSRKLGSLILSVNSEDSVTESAVRGACAEGERQTEQKHYRLEELREPNPQPMLPRLLYLLREPLLTCRPPKLLTDTQQPTESTDLVREPAPPPRHAPLRG